MSSDFFGDLKRQVQERCIAWQVIVATSHMIVPMNAAQRKSKDYLDALMKSIKPVPGIH